MKGSVVVHRPVRAGSAVVGVEVGSSLYRPCCTKTLSERQESHICRGDRVFRTLRAEKYLQIGPGATGLEPATSGVTGQCEVGEVNNDGRDIALFMRV
jgi:hypothetical protein